jgi:hypothetical protein
MCAFLIYLEQTPSLFLRVNEELAERQVQESN